MSNPNDPAAEIAALRSHVEHLQSRIMMLETDRIADACQLDRMAIQIQILRVDSARQRDELAALRARINDDREG